MKDKFYDVLTVLFISTLIAAVMFKLADILFGAEAVTYSLANLIS